MAREQSSRKNRDCLMTSMAASRNRPICMSGTSRQGLKTV